LVFIDVNLGQEKGKHKLTVYEQDSPSRVAKRFGDKHELAEGKVKMLEKLLR
jgi:hypothetical protein